MTIVLRPDGTLCLETGLCALDGLRPVINGEEADGPWHVRIAAADGGEFECVLGGAGVFRLSWTSTAGRFYLRYSIDSPNLKPLRSFGLCVERLTNVGAFLRNGYFSWDGSSYVRVADDIAAQAVCGYAMTQLLGMESSRNVVVGFDRHERFQHTFTFEQHASRLTIETLWDEKETSSAAARCESERLGILVAEDVEGGLRAWAQLVAECALVPPRVATPRIRGWCSWYNLYAAITEANVLEHLRGARAIASREELPMSVFQIDDGFTPEMGDWLDVKAQFPRGMKPLLDDIRAAGFKPGLWIAPFMVGNRSRLYAQHPDWVVQDRTSGRPLAHMRFYGEFRWHKRSEEYYILDTTHPDAMAWLREVFRVWREDWGCEYFKTDFMQFGSEYGPKRARWHGPGLTRIEIWRQTAEMIRSVIGDAVWLGCGCPLWASTGLVDGVRIGRDMGVEWKGEQSAQSLLRDQATRNFAHRILWQADPDCVLLRERFHSLSDVEVRSLALYAGMTGGVAMTSDALDELSANRLQLWKLLLTFGQDACRFPLLGESVNDPVIVQVRGDESGSALVLILNPSDTVQERRYSLRRLGLRSPLHAWDWHATRAQPEPLHDLSVKIEPHDCVLLYLTAAPIDRPPKDLP